MLTANRIQQFLNSAYEWDALVRRNVTLASRSQPRVATSENSVLFELDLPGRQREEIQVEAEDHWLTISLANRQAAEESVKYIVRERDSGWEERRFQLPFRIEADKADVTLANGILSITVHKPEEERPRKLDVRTAD